MALLFRNDTNLLVKCSLLVEGRGTAKGGNRQPSRIDPPVFRMGSGMEGTGGRSWYLNSMGSMATPPTTIISRALPRSLWSHRVGPSSRNIENEVKRSPKREISQQHTVVTYHLVYTYGVLIIIYLRKIF